MLYSVLGIIGVDVSSDYKWTDTLILETSLAKKCSKEEYLKCRRFIILDYASDVNLTSFREISKGLFIAENGFYDREYGVEISKVNSSKICIRTTQECNEWLIIVLQLHLIQEEYLLIHSAGLVKDNKVLLLPSWGGVGKTACVVKLINEKKCNLLGDDLVAINKRGIAKAFLKDFVIYSYHKNLFPKVFKNKGVKKPIVPIRMNYFVSRIIPYIKPVLRKSPALLAFLRKNNPQSKVVSPVKVFNRKYLGGEGRIRRLIWLERIQTKDNYSINTELTRPKSPAFIGYGYQRTIKPSMDSTNIQRGLNPPLNEVLFNRISKDQMISKILSVSIFEIFNTKIDAICVLCGCGLLDYKNVFIKPYQILSQAIIDSETFILKLPVSTCIDSVPDILMEALESIGGV